MSLKEIIKMIRKRAMGSLNGLQIVSMRAISAETSDMALEL
jgi:uncharacterized protein YcsI (UPF0317 family)